MGDQSADPALRAAKVTATRLLRTIDQTSNTPQWLHHRELPNPSLTAKLRPPVDVPCGPSLREMPLVSFVPLLQPVLMS